MDNNFTGGHTVECRDSEKIKNSKTLLNMCWPKIHQMFLNMSWLKWSSKLFGDVHGSAHLCYIFGTKECHK